MSFWHNPRILALFRSSMPSRNDALFVCIELKRKKEKKVRLEVMNNASSEGRRMISDLV